MNNVYRISGREPDPPPPWVVFLQVRDVPHFYHEKIVDDDGCLLIAWHESTEFQAVTALQDGFKRGYFVVDSIFIPTSNVICAYHKLSAAASQ